MKFTKPRRKIDRVFIHCSASDNPAHDDVKVIKRWHTGKRPDGRGWSDIGYHYFIRKSGQIEAGRPLEKTPAAQLYHNTGTIAICCHGLEESKFTEAQFKALRDLCGQIDVAYFGKVTFHGHREVANKTCPVFNYKKVLGLDTAGHLGTKPVMLPVIDDEPAFTHNLARGAQGPLVEAVQRALHAHGFGPIVGRVDGDYGPKTEQGVKAFRAKYLIVPGVVDEETHNKLFEGD